VKNYRNEETDKQRRNWHEHILRMDKNRTGKMLLNYKAEEHKVTGRPKVRWKDKLSFRVKWPEGLNVEGE
jgi:hypothetical protein